MIEELPLSEFPHLLSYAEERESEKALVPLWVAHYAVSKLSGKEPVSIEELMAKVTETDSDRAHQKTPEEIELDFAAVILGDRQRMAKEV